jgi:hypothetical protein
MSMLKLPFLVDLQQKVGNFLSFNNYFKKYFKLVCRNTVVVITLATGVMFHLFPCMYFLMFGSLRRCPRVGRPPMKWSATTESLRNTGVSYLKLRHTNLLCKAWTGTGLVCVIYTLSTTHASSVCIIHV